MTAARGLPGLVCAGLIAGLAATGAQAACPARVAVGFGDTLASIARACGINVETLRAANPGLSPETLQPGLYIAVPRPALPSPQLPVGRPSVRPVPSLAPPAGVVMPPAVILPPPSPAMRHPQVPPGFDTRPPHMQPPKPRAPQFP